MLEFVKPIPSRSHAEDPKGTDKYLLRTHHASRLASKFTHYHHNSTKSSACKPFGFFLTTKLTLCPAFKDRIPVPGIAEK